MNSPPSCGPALELSARAIYLQNSRKEPGARLIAEIRKDLGSGPNPDAVPVRFPRLRDPSPKHLRTPASITQRAPRLRASPTMRPDMPPFGADDDPHIKQALNWLLSFADPRDWHDRLSPIEQRLFGAPTQPSDFCQTGYDQQDWPDDDRMGWCTSIWHVRPQTIPSSTSRAKDAGSCRFSSDSARTWPSSRRSTASTNASSVYSPKTPSNLIPFSSSCSSLCCGRSTASIASSSSMNRRIKGRPTSGHRTALTNGSSSASDSTNTLNIPARSVPSGEPCGPFFPTA